MRAHFGDIKYGRHVFGQTEVGRYALESDNPDESPYWDNCREQFDPKFKESVNGFYFSHDANTSDNIAGFILKTETVLGLESLQSPWPLTNYQKTSKSTVTWIVPSPFWKRCGMRRSLLTILLRCGMNYDPDKDNYEYALFEAKNQYVGAQEYTRATHLAVMRFLFGFTKYVPHTNDNHEKSEFINKNGWVAIFSNKDQQEVRKRLVLPDHEESLKTVVGVEALWA